HQGPRRGRCPDWASYGPAYGFRELAVAPTALAAVVGLEDGARDAAAARDQREQEARKIVDVDDRGTARWRHGDHAPARGLEQLENLAVARAVDRRGSDNRPVEPAGLDDLLGVMLGLAVAR